MGKSGVLFIFIFALLVAFAFFPLVILCILSFNETVTLPLRNFPTAKWYIQLFRSSTAMGAIINSFIVAGVTTLVAVLLGICGGFALVRTRFVGSRFFPGLLIMPMVIPYIIMGVGLLSFLLRVGVNLSLATVIIGHILVAIPYSTLTLTARFVGFDISLEEAAMDLGADKFTTFRKITLPLMMPGIIISAILAFIISWEDVSLATFLVGTDPTIPIYINTTLARLPKNVPVLTALSTLMVAFAIVLAFVMRAVEKFELVK
jgi:spermidine/putrescine transport system permease protein